MNKIKVRCYTNLDDYSCSEVTEMCCRPIIGDYVQVLYKGIAGRNLRIIKITHLKGSSLLIGLSN